MGTATFGSEDRFFFDGFSAVLLFLVAILGAWLPKYLTDSSGAHVSSSHSFAFHMGNMLSAGVMLSAGFCHLLADAHRYLLFVGRFPMSNFLAATGYIITLLADQVVQYVSDQNASAQVNATAVAAPMPSHGSYKSLASSAELTALPAGGGLPVSKPPSGPVHREHAGHVNGHDPGHHQPSTPRGGGGDGGKLPLLAAAHTHGNGGGAQQHGHADEERPLLAPSLSVSGGGAAAARLDECHAGVAVLLGGRKLSFATAVLLAGALCIHSILEGMALGAQQSMRSTEDIMVAIAAHKGLAAYALGASIVESGASSKRFWTVIGLFSMATPVGILLGYAMSSSASSQSGAALSALASGTFLYVAFMEVIPKELADGQHRLAKMAAFLTGYGLMSMLAIWA